MTETQQMQQPSENIDTMITTDSGAGPPASTNHIETERLDPHTSLDDYNRTMLEYTQRQMSTFVDLDDSNGRSGSSQSSSRSSESSSRSSQSSGNSGTSGIARQANGPPPTSAGAAAAARLSPEQSLRSARSPNEAKPSQY